MRRSLHILSVLSVCAACRHGETVAGVKDVTLAVEGYPAPAPCEADQASAVFQLVAAGTVERTDVALKGTLTLSPGRDESLFGWRFDVCLDGNNQAILKRLVHRRSSAGFAFSTSYDAYVPAAGGPDPGLTKAVFGEGYSDLKVTVINSQDSQASLLVKGGKTAAGQGFATLSFFDAAAADPLTVSTPVVAYGQLIAGDPWVRKYKTNDRQISGPAVSLEMRYEYNGFPGGYIAYKFHKIVLHDANPGLAQPLVVTLQDADLAAHWKTNLTHHGLTDTFVLTVPEAVYLVNGHALEVHYTNPAIPPVTVPLPCHFAVECGQFIGTGPDPAGH